MAFHAACFFRVASRITFAVSSNLATVVAVASAVPSLAVNLPFIKAIVLPIWMTFASAMSSPGQAGARKFTIRLIVVG